MAGQGAERGSLLKDPLTSGLNALLLFPSALPPHPAAVTYRRHFINVYLKELAFRLRGWLTFMSLIWASY